MCQKCFINNLALYAFTCKPHIVMSCATKAVIFFFFWMLVHMLLLIFFLGAAQLPSFRDTYLSPASTFARGCERACFARGLFQQSEK